MSRLRPAIFASVLTLLAASSQAQPTADLLAAFRTPPDSAKPMVRWWWFGPAVEKPEILRELQQMKADGIGGAELAFVYPETLEGNVPFLSAPDARRRHLRPVRSPQARPPHRPHPLLRLALRRPRHHPRRSRHPPPHRRSRRPPGTTTVASPTLADGETLLSAALVTGTPTPPPVRRGPRPPPRPTNLDPATSHPLSPTGASTTIPAATEPRVALFFIQPHQTRGQARRRRSRRLRPRPLLPRSRSHPPPGP